MDIGKKKRPFYKTWWFTLILVAFLVAGAISLENSQYEVGRNLKAGEYVLTAFTSKTPSSFQVSGHGLDQPDARIIASSNFKNRTIVTVSNGQYFKIRGCIMYESKDAPAVKIKNGMLPEGMYKVGVDIQAGKYVIAPVGEGYVEIAKNSSHTSKSIISNFFLNQKMNITVDDGQYIKLVNANLIIN